MKKLIAGNWKMNGSFEQSVMLIDAICGHIESNRGLLDRVDLLVCPAFIHIHAAQFVAFTRGNLVELGGQDCATQDNGAFTGDISAKMLRDAKCTHVILGHSERRQHHGETSETVAAKAAKAHEAGLVAIVCVGETEAERASGQQEAVVEAQLRASLPPTAGPENTVIAYEPVWAIGTGKTATPADVKAMHGFIRSKLKELVEKPKNMRILYGGSVNAANAAGLLATENVDGALVGGASLKADQFLAIAQAA